MGKSGGQKKQSQNSANSKKMPYITDNTTNDDGEDDDDETNSTTSKARQKPNAPQHHKEENYRSQELTPTPGSTDEYDDETPSILFSCRCESARPVTTLLSCLRKVSLSNNAGSGPTLSSLQEASSNRMTQSVMSTAGKGGGSGGSGGGSKVQYATVFVSEKSITFQVHGVGKQSRATVDMQAGLFSEYYVAEQMVPIEDDEEEEDAEEGSRVRESQQDIKMEVVKGGEFGINLTTLLECLCVLGPNTLDRTTLCLSYDSQAAIFKIELLEQCYGPSSGGGPGGSICSSLNSGVIISNCAIPGMAVADDGDDDHNGEGHLTLDHAFRSHPILARARIKSDFLKDAISELTDVGGSTAATIGISKLGLELATFGHSTECHVVVPYAGNHPEIFVSLEGVGERENILHARNYPLHSILSAMRGLEIASETCITINGNGMVAIQHQVLDQVGNGDPNYVDFIMCCLEGDYEDEEEDSNGVFDISQSAAAATLVENGSSGRRIHNSTQQSDIPFIVEERENLQSQLSAQEAKKNQTQSQQQQQKQQQQQQTNKDGHGDDDGDGDESDTDMDTPKNTMESSDSQQTISLFGTVANIGAVSESFNSRSNSLKQNFQRRRNKNRQNDDDDDNDSTGYQSPKKRRSLQKSSNEGMDLDKKEESQRPEGIATTSHGGDNDDAEESEFEEEENSLDVTAAVASSSYRRRSLRRKSGEDSASSPQLMYGDTHLEASDDDDGL